MLLRSLQRGMSPWLPVGLAATASSCAAALSAALDRLCSSSDGAAVGSRYWAQQPQQRGRQQWLQERCFRSAPTFKRINGGNTLEERRRQHVQRHTVTAEEALQVGGLASAAGW